MPLRSQASLHPFRRHLPQWRGSRPLAILFSAVLLLLAGAAACSRAPEEKAPSILIQVGESRLTTAEFESAWTAWRAAAGGDGETEPQARQADRTRLLQELIEEMILLERARELGLSVDDAELAAAVAVVRRDFPGEAFEQMLVENAVALPQWEAGLRRQMIIDKLIAQDLTAQIRITEDEIAARYRASQAEHTAGGGAGAPAEGLHDQLVQQLRREKAEAAYADWVQELRRRMTVQINETLLSQVLGAPPEGVRVQGPAALPSKEDAAK
jgi:hypothetical protein